MRSTACVLPDLLAFSGQDGGDEGCVGVAAALKVADDGVRVEGDTSLGDGKGVAVVFQQEPAGGAGGVGHAGGAGVEDADAGNEAIGDEVGVAADDDVGIASGEQGRELLLGESASFSTARSATSLPWMSAMIPSLMRTSIETDGRGRIGR